MKRILTFFALIAIMVGLSAQSPEKMSYQAVVRNGSNQLVTNQTVGMKISILQGSAVGTAEYIETQIPTTNANGLVTIEIGGGAVISGTFSTIDWANGPYFLKTETDPTGGTNYAITGTSQLLSVPYALHAKTAENGFSGNYNDLSNTPILFDGDYNSLSNKPPFFSGAFSDLTGKPSNLAGYGITDAMSTSHVANGITSTNITNWNTAYGWGNHAGLYRPVGWVPAWTEVTGKPTTTNGFGITDAVTITGDQTIAGIKTFNRDLLISGLTVGRGGFGITDNTNTAIGCAALFFSTTGRYNTATGDWALHNNTTGNGNTAYGATALLANTTGNQNTANGVGALYSNTTGNYNTANGLNALYNNTIGATNTANGANALYSNIIGIDNTANGVKALYYNIAGNGNTANGVTALYSNTTGNYNAATGAGALYSNTTGNQNTANGLFALYWNTTGSDNIANGFYALNKNTTGSYNTANGSGSLFRNTTASYNTANGYQVLYENTTGNANTANGYWALHLNTTGNNNTVNGFNALYNNTTGNSNTANGNGALLANTTGSYNTAVGFGSNVASGDLINATAIGSNATVNASNKVIIGNSAVTSIGGFANWANFSDRRLKENIVYKSDLGLKFINQLQTVSYNYKADSMKHRRDGLIAQDVEKVLNELGLKFSGLVIDDDKDKTMNLSYGDFVIPLINAVQELSKQNNEIIKENNEMKNEIGKLKSVIETLKQQ